MRVAPVYVILVGTPPPASGDTAHPNSATNAFQIQNFNGAFWSQVGIDLGSAMGEGGISIAFNPSTNEPYVAYADGGSLYFVIQKFDGTSWSQVGIGLGFTVGEAGISLAFTPSTNEPYVAFPDAANNAFQIKKFNGDWWRGTMS